MLVREAWVEDAGGIGQGRVVLRVEGLGGEAAGQASLP